MATTVLNPLFDPRTAADTRNCLLLVLGRQALSHHEILFYQRASVAERICRMVENMEFRVEVETPISLIGFASAARFTGEPSARFIAWLKEAIPLEETSRRQVEDAGSWRELLVTVWSDPNFVALLRDNTMSDGRIGLFVDGLRRVPAADGRPLSQRFSCELRSLEDGASLMSIGAGSTDVKQPELTEITYFVREMIRVKPWQKGFVSTESDPQLIFPSLTPGVYHFRMRIVYEHTTPNTQTDYAQIFFDFGHDYSERNSFTFPISNGTVAVEAILEIQKPVKTLRLDPTIGPADFRFEHLSLSIMH